jgi:hypothetical protein
MLTGHFTFNNPSSGYNDIAANISVIATITCQPDKIRQVIERLPMHFDIISIFK